MTASELLPLIRANGRSDRFSENLYKWVKAQMAPRKGDFEIGVSFTAHSIIDGSIVVYDPAKTQPSHIIITTLPADDCTFGARLSCIIGEGTKAKKWAFPNGAFKIYPLSDGWWQGYIKGGKCWIAPEHRLYMDKERWIVSDDGKMRSCLWCGAHRQYKHIEMVPRETWSIEEPQHIPDKGTGGGEMIKVICDHAGECSNKICEHKQPHTPFVNHDIFVCEPDICESIGEIVHCVETAV